MTFVHNLLKRIVDSFTTEDGGPSGAEAVRSAISEVEEIHEEFHAQLGEPDVVEGGNRYFTDPKIIIPIEDTPYGTSPQLVFDMPGGRNDEHAEFNRLLNLFDVTLDSMEELTGKEIPISFYAGNVTVMWDNTKPDDGESTDGDVSIDQETISTGD